MIPVWLFDDSRRVLVATAVPGTIELDLCRLFANIKPMRRLIADTLCVASLALAACPLAASATDQLGAESSNIQALVSAWASAWSSGRFGDYTAYYVDGYKGDFSSSEAWRAQRRSRIAGRGDIDVDTGAVLVRFNLHDPDTAQAVFVQSYRSETWCDVVEKTLDLERTRSGWRISGERSRERTRC